MWELWARPRAGERPSTLPQHSRSPERSAGQPSMALHCSIFGIQLRYFRMPGPSSSGLSSLSQALSPTATPKGLPCSHTQTFTAASPGQDLSHLRAIACAVPTTRNASPLLAHRASSCSSFKTQGPGPQAHSRVWRCGWNLRQLLTARPPPAVPTVTGGQGLGEAIPAPPPPPPGQKPGSSSSELPEPTSHTSITWFRIMPITAAAG